MSNAEEDNELLYNSVKEFKGKKVDVRISIVDAGLTFTGKLILGFDSRLHPPRRLNIHDTKGNLLLIQLDEYRMDVILS